MASSRPESSSSSAETSFYCLLCWENLPVSSAIRPAPCGHPACAKCLHAYWQFHAKEGRAAAPSCLYPGCKERTPRVIVNRCLLSSPQNMSQIINEQVQDHSEPFGQDHCSLCMRHLSQNLALRPSSCGHPVCFACLRQHWRRHIQDRGETAAPCVHPHCETHTPWTAVKQNMTGLEARKHTRQLQSSTITSGVDARERFRLTGLQAMQERIANRHTTQGGQASAIEQFKGFRAAATFRCVICKQTLPAVAALRPADCAHASCYACLRAYWTHSINAAKNPRPRCPQPGCEQHAHMSALRKVLPDAVARQASILLVLRLLPDSEYAKRRREIGYASGQSSSR